MKVIYELVDATDDETYFTLGVFSTLLAVYTAMDGCCPSNMTDLEHEEYIKFELRERSLDKLTNVWRVVEVFEWTHEYDEDTDEYNWTEIKEEEE